MITTEWRPAPGQYVIYASRAVVEMRASLARSTATGNLTGVALEAQLRSEATERQHLGGIT